VAEASAIDGDDQADEIRRAVAQAVQRAVDGAISVGAAVDQALAAVAERHAATTAAQTLRQESAALLAAYDRRGGGRNAAMAVAKAFARDRYDPLELERIAQRVRALARGRKTKPKKKRRPLRLAG